jgi:hypothetical protein
LGVSRQGEFKNTINIFLQKFRCQFFLDFFCFIAFSGVSQRREFKHTTKNVSQKKSRRKVFTKNSTKNPKPTFSRFLYHVFGRFSMRGVQKHDKKHRKINLTLVLFRTLTHPPTTGVTDFFFGAGPLFFGPSVLVMSIGHRERVVHLRHRREAGSKEAEAKAKAKDQGSKPGPS